MAYSNATAASDCWVYWNDDSSTGYSNDTTTTVWVKWSSCGASDSTWGRWQATAVICGYAKPRELTAEQRAERERARIEAEERTKRQTAEAEAAQKRAEELLVQTMSVEQKESYTKNRKFHVIGSDGQRYEVDCTKRQHNVFAVNDEGKRTREFCLVQTGGTPLADNHLAQKLLLEADAEQFKRVANKWDLVPARQAA